MPIQRPLIGITTDYNDKKTQYALNYSYAQAVERAGGLPVMLPYRVPVTLIPDYLARIDGFILAGGDDLDPASYGETFHPKASPVDPPRQQFELALVDALDRAQTPVLGICLGHQLVNVHRGGSLHQFLPDLSRNQAIEHRRLEDWGRRHSVTINPTSRLATIMGRTITETNTSHKQAVNSVGRNLIVTAHSPDGVIEAAEDPNHPFLVTVQWHPERMIDSPEHLNLFRALVETASRRAARSHAL